MLDKTPKVILRNDPAESLILSGVSKLAETVGSTLGPAGRNVLIHRDIGLPTSTKDGVTVAKSIFLEDPVENMAAQLVKSVASKVCDRAGDGTTTSTVLAHAILEGGMTYLAHNPQATAVSVVRDIRALAARTVEELRSIKVDKPGIDLLSSVARTSSNNDPKVYEKVCEAFATVNYEGRVTVEKSSGKETKLVHSPGYVLDKGYINPAFITDPKEAITSYSGNKEIMFLLIGDALQELSTPLANTLNAVMAEGHPLVIIAENVEGEALRDLVTTRIQSNPPVPICALRAPGFGDRRTETLEDLAIMLDTEVFSHANGNLDDVEPSRLGRAKKFVAEANRAVIIDGAGSAEDIEERCEVLKSQAIKSTSDFDTEQLNDRASALVGGLVRILVGGTSEVEMNETKDRFDDAVGAVSAAIAHGALPGGGVPLIVAANEAVSAAAAAAPDAVTEGIGLGVWLPAAKTPYLKVTTNAGMADVAQDRMDRFLHTAHRYANKAELMQGVDATTGKLVQLFDAGIVDAAEVTIAAVEQAASVASELLLTSYTIHEGEKKLIAQ